MASERIRRFRGALVGAAVGDAMGAPLEGRPGPVETSVLLGVISGSQSFAYTDDTAMTIVLAESLLACGGLDQDHLAASFAAAWEREPNRGYGSGTARLLSDVAAGGDWRNLAAGQFGGSGSFGNGAAMRVAPVALYARGDLAKSAVLGRSSAMVTHAHPIGAEAAVVQAVAVAHALSASDDTAEHLLGSLDDAIDQAELRLALAKVERMDPSTEPGEVAAAVGTGVAGHEAVPAAIAAFILRRDSFEDALTFAWSMGGDTDTIGSMAVAIAGARLGFDSIPERWVRAVEGTGQLIELADRLASDDHYR